MKLWFLILSGKSYDKKEQYIYNGLIHEDNFKKVWTWDWCLQELLEIGVYPEERKTDKYQANIKIEILLKFFEKKMKDITGTAYKQVQQRVENLKCCSVSLCETVKVGDTLISPNVFYSSHMQSAEKWLVSSEDVKLSRYAKVLDKKK